MSKLTPEQRKRFDYLRSNPASVAAVKRHAHATIFGKKRSSTPYLVGLGFGMLGLLLAAKHYGP